MYFKDVIPPKISGDSIVKDMLSQLERIGKVVKTAHKDKSVWVEYEKVEYAQIAYLVLKVRVEVFSIISMMGRSWWLVSMILLCLQISFDGVLQFECLKS